MDALRTKVWGVFWALTIFVSRTRSLVLNMPEPLQPGIVIQHGQQSPVQIGRAVATDQCSNKFVRSTMQIMANCKPRPTLVEVAVPSMVPTESLGTAGSVRASVDDVPSRVSPKHIILHRCAGKSNFLTCVHKPCSEQYTMLENLTTTTTSCILAKNGSLDQLLTFHSFIEVVQQYLVRTDRRRTTKGQEPKTSFNLQYRLGKLEGHLLPSQLLVHGSEGVGLKQRFELLT